MIHNIKKVSKYSKGWLVYIATTRETCNCAGKPIILQFEQEKEPTEYEIKNRIESL